MGFSYRKSFDFSPLRINLSKSGIGASVGVKGLRTGIDSKGRGYSSIAIPNTGIRGRTGGGGLMSGLTEIYQESAEKTLGFDYNWDYYYQKLVTPKGCLGIVIGLFLLSMPPVGIIYFIGLYVWSRKQKDTPTEKFRSTFASAYVKATVAEYNEAITLLDKCGEIEPNNTDYLDLSGVCYLQLGDYEKAASFFEKVNKVKPDDNRIKKLLASSLSNLDSTDSHKLVSLYSDFVSANPDDDNAKFLLGYHLSATQKFEEAIMALQKIQPDSELYIKALSGIATCYYQMNNYDKAIEVLKLAPLKQKQLTDDLKAVHYHLGELYELKGDKETALKHYEIIELQDLGFRDVRVKISNLKN